MLTIVSLFASSAGSAGGEAVATLVRTSRPLRDPLRASSANLSTIAQRLNGHDYKPLTTSEFKPLNLSVLATASFTTGQRTQAGSIGRLAKGAPRRRRHRSRQSVAKRRAKRLRGPLRASSANLTVVAERLEKYAALYRAHKHVIPAVEPPVDMYLQGFARHPGLVKPHWYIGSLQATQGEALKASLVTAGVPAENITWVEGVTPAAIERGNWSMPGKGTSSELGCSMAHLRMIKTAYDAGHATAVMLEGDTSLRLMGLWGRPVALSEKGQTKRGAQSAGLHLADVYSDLERAQWDICQLCLLTLKQERRNLLRSVQQMHSAMAKGNTVVYRNPRTYSQAWGTAAYTVSRAGMARILNSYWPGGEHGPAYAALPRGARFTTHQRKTLSEFRVASDHILYDTPGGTLNAFLSVRPLFDATTKHSDIDSGRLDLYAKSNYLLESMFYPLLPGSRHVNS